MHCIGKRYRYRSIINRGYINGVVGVIGIELTIICFKIESIGPEIIFIWSVSKWAIGIKCERSFFSWFNKLKSNRIIFNIGAMWSKPISCCSSKWVVFLNNVCINGIYWGVIYWTYIDPNNGCVWFCDTIKKCIMDAIYSNVICFRNILIWSSCYIEISNATVFWLLSNYVFRIGTRNRFWSKSTSNYFIFLYI